MQGQVVFMRTMAPCADQHRLAPPAPRIASAPERLARQWPQAVRSTPPVAFSHTSAKYSNICDSDMTVGPQPPLPSQRKSGRAALKIATRQRPRRPNMEVTVV